MRKGSLILLTCLFLTTFSVAQPTDTDIANGEQARELINRQIGTYDHSAIDYLHSIGQRLVSNLEDPVHDYRYGIVDMSDPNALALPDGYIYFSRGILLLANSEDELAGILGHETIHVARYHSRKANKKSIFTGILKIPGAIVGAFSPVAGGILMTPVSLFDAGYSRQHERQADEFGVKLAAKSGYDPNGMVSIFGKIAGEAMIMTGEVEQRSFFSTHPYTPKRVDHVTKTIEKLDYVQTGHFAPDHKTFLEKLDGIVIGKNPAKGVFHSNQFIHPTFKFTLSFPEGWKGMNTMYEIGWASGENDAQAMLVVIDSVISSTENAEEFAKSYYTYYGMIPAVNEKMEINGNPAHSLVYKSYSDGKPIVLTLLWMEYGDFTFRFALLGLDKYRRVVEDMAKSLHEMTKEERNLIQQTLLNIVQANEGEDLMALSGRTGNVLDLEYTALINDLKTDQALSEGQWIKIGVVSKY